MARRLGAVVAVVLLAGLVAATVPGGADAQVQSPPSPWAKFSGGFATSQETDALMRNIMAHQDTEARRVLERMGEGERRNFLRRLFKARVGARLFPAVARVSLLGTGVYVGWTIYQRWSKGGDHVYDMYLDSALLGKDALFNVAEAFVTGLPGSTSNPYATPQGRAEYSWGVVRWLKRTGIAQSDCPVQFGISPCARLELRVHMVPPISSWADEWPFIYYESLPFGQIPANQHTHWQVPDIDECDPFSCLLTDGGSTRPWNHRRWADLGITRTQEAVTDGRLFGGEPAVRVQTHPSAAEPGGGPLYGVYITEEQLESIIGPVTEVVTPGAASTNPSPDMTDTYTVPQNQGTATDVEKAIEPFNDDCGRAFVNHVIEPERFPYVPGCIEDPVEPAPDADVMTLPQPLVSETYAEYLVRLQELGYLGSAVQVELDPSAGEPAMGPEGIAWIRGKRPNGTMTTWRPLAWPETSPAIRNDTDLELGTNPDSYPNPKGDTGAPGAPGGLPTVGGGGCEPYLRAAPNFGPLLGIKFGNVFPFGLFVWVRGLFDELLASPVAPSFSFDFDWLGIEPDYVVDLALLDPYMAIVRRLLSWVLWVGAIWFGAVSLLGIRNSGDPGEAIDDVI